MSAVPSLSIQVKPDEAVSRKRNHLKPVQRDAKSTPRRNPILLTLVSLIGILSIFSGQLWLNLAVSGGAYEIRTLELEQRDLSRVERTLQLELDRLASPQNLAEKASNLKMVQNSKPALLDLANKTIIGTTVAATSTPKGNTIENSALANMRLADEVVTLGEGQIAHSATVSAQAAASTDASQSPENKQAAKPKENSSTVAIPWEGKLTAPETR